MHEKKKLLFVLHLRLGLVIRVNSEVTARVKVRVRFKTTL
jgi:hypothetical protein